VDGTGVTPESDAGERSYEWHETGLAKSGRTSQCGGSPSGHLFSFFYSGPSMARQPFFWRIFLLFAGLQLATLITFLILFSKWQEQLVVRAEERRLHDSVVVLRSLLRSAFEEDDRDRMQQIASSVGSETDSRVTLVGMDGVVFADSRKDPSAMENHKDRPELVSAALSGEGTSQRFSATIGVSMLYYAKRIDRDVAEGEQAEGAEGSMTVPNDPMGFVRCALPLSVLRDKASQMKRTLWWIASGYSVFCLGLTYYFVRRALQPVRNLTQAALAMAKGEYQQRVSVRRRDELGELASSFNDMSSGIEAREAQLREGTGRMVAVLSGMVEAVIAVDNEQRVMFANHAAGDIFEISPDSVQGSKLLDAIPSHALNQIVVSSLEDEGELESKYVEIRSRNNAILSVNAARLPGDPCPGMVLVMHDISELRRLEQLRQEFVANVSHELKTPLSAILAYAETLQGGALDDPKTSRRFVQQIEDQAGRLSDLIQDMLQLARIEAGQVLYEVGKVVLMPVVDMCIASHSTKAQARNVRLTAQRELPDVALRGNREALRQILDNLVDNAVKYTPEGGEVHVSWTSEGEFVMLQVKDDGIGIPYDHQERIFERFYRVDKARSREMGGTGLGLSIVKHLAQTLGGSVTVESVEGEGTKFRVWLPAHR